MGRQYYAAMFGVVLLAGCNSGESSNNVEYTLNQKFDGHPAGEFFHDYGFPVARYASLDNGASYKWASTQLGIHPEEAYLTSSYNNTYQVANDHHGRVARQYCELHVDVDSNDVIRNISVSVDSQGKFSRSRCSEIF